MLQLRDADVFKVGGDVNDIGFHRLRHAQDLVHLGRHGQGDAHGVGGQAVRQTAGGGERQLAGDQPVIAGDKADLVNAHLGGFYCLVDAGEGIDLNDHRARIP